LYQNLYRSPSLREQKWIVDNCRTNPEKELGPRRDLYENWQKPQVVLERPPKPTVATRTQLQRQPMRERFDSEVVRFTLWDHIEAIRSSRCNESVTFEDST
jgi:hypothetical protein